MAEALRAFARATRSLARSEDGAASVWSIFMMTMMMMISGFVLDVSNAYRIRAQLQATADASALAAAGKLPDADAARDAAIALSEINMPVEKNGHVTLPTMVEIGYYDADGGFVPDSEPFEAVRVSAARGRGAGLPVPTFLIGMLGQDSWQVAASSTARIRAGVSNTGGDVCSGAMILSENEMNTGGNNTLSNGVCLHGETGLHTGGNDWFSPDVRLSAADIDDIVISPVRAGSATADQVKREMSLAPSLLPNLNAQFDALWTTLYQSGISTYGGELLPDFIYNSAGYANIVRVNQWWWTVQRGDLQPHTIYLVNHGMQLAGGVDAQNVAIIAKGQIGVGGGPDLHFDKVYFFGEGALNLAGNISYGDPQTYCDDGKFDVYLFSKERIGLGGWGPSAWIYGMVAAAPDFQPGGSMKSAGGIYVEARNTIQLGGNTQISGCGTRLEADMDLSFPPGEPTVIAAGGSLVR